MKERLLKVQQAVSGQLSQYQHLNVEALEGGNAAATEESAAVASNARGILEMSTGLARHTATGEADLETQRETQI